VSQNFQAIEKFDKDLIDFLKQDADASSVKEVLLSHFKEVFEKKVSFSCFCFSSFLFVFFYTSAHCLSFEQIQ